MEKVKIINVEKKTSKNGKEFFTITLDDSRKISGFEDLSEFKNQELDLEVFKKNEYWNYSYKPQKKGAGAVPKSDKQVALECASRMETNPEEVLKAATLYLTWLKQND